MQASLRHEDNVQYLRTRIHLNPCKYMFLMIVKLIIWCYFYFYWLLRVWMHHPLWLWFGEGEFSYGNLCSLLYISSLICNQFLFLYVWWYKMHKQWIHFGFLCFYFFNLFIWVYHFFAKKIFTLFRSYVHQFIEIESISWLNFIFIGIGSTL